jgi:rhodanese-related sulfurtransferase
MLQKIEPHSTKQWLDEGRAILIDVREPSEYAREHIIDARLVPLSSFDREDFSADRDKTVVFYCQSGTRTAANAERLLGPNFESVRMLEGGIAAWKKAGLPVHFDNNAPIDIMRQVQITAGSLVVAGIILGLLVSPWFLALSAFVGAGLTFAGVSGRCGMASLLARMPWNQTHLTPSTGKG